LAAARIAGSQADLQFDSMQTTICGGLQI